jgi:hypothetical protein
MNIFSPEAIFKGHPDNANQILDNYSRQSYPKANNCRQQVEKPVA